MPRRRPDRTDDNQDSIVRQLRSMEGISVEVGHDDILVGHRGRTYWYEIKRPECRLKDGTGWKKGAIKDYQIQLAATYTGHYKIVTTLAEILEDIST
jgi:hypothetical protein